MIIRRATTDNRTWAPDSQPLLPFARDNVHARNWSLAAVRLRFRVTLSRFKKAFTALCLFLILGHIAAMPAIRAIQASQIDLTGVQHLHLGIKITETILAVLSVAIVASVYSLLISRGTLMSTTAIYPSSAIENNVSRLLSVAWPDHSGDVHAGNNPETSPPEPTTAASPQYKRKSPIRLLYLGKMCSDEDSGLVAKGMQQAQAMPKARIPRSSVWLTSGSPLTKTIVQLLIWEWVLLWLVVIMIVTVLLYNNFVTGNLTVDSYPRLTIIVIYALGYLSHLVFIWRTVLKFVTNVGAGAAWSLLERANFVVCHHTHLRRHERGRHFSFSSIDKASKEHVPTVYEALFKHETRLVTPTAVASPMTPNLQPPIEDPTVVKAALATIKASQENEREAARDAAAIALERVIQNAMIVTGIILSSGFSSWTSTQTTENTPNNFNSQQVGSLALLASLSLGAAAMFSSAMHLSVMESSFATILSLKETKINGLAVDHYKKRSATHASLSFMNHNSDFTAEGYGATEDNAPNAPHSGNLEASRITFFHVLMLNKVTNLLQVLFLGPAFALLPTRKDHMRTSKNLQFELQALVRDSLVLFTTQKTDGHILDDDGENVEAINVCAVPTDDESNNKGAKGNVLNADGSEKEPLPICESV